MNILLFATLYRNDSKERQHHISEMLSNDGYQVVWFNPTGSINYSFIQLLKKYFIVLSKRYKYRKTNNDWMGVVKNLLFIPRHTPAFNKINVLLVKFQISRMKLENNGVVITYYASDIVVEICKWLKKKYKYRIVYDNVQRINSTYYPEGMKVMEAQLIKVVDSIICDSITIKKDMEKIYSRDSIQIPQGIFISDFTIRDTSLNKKIQYEMKEIQRPIYGYIGGLHHAFDSELIEYIAQKMPDASIVLVGPILDESIKFTQDNIFCLGKKDYSLLAYYIMNFDICLIPYKVNSFTEGVFPTKMLEYIACEKPIVSVDLPDVHMYSEYIHIAKNYEDFVNGLRKQKLVTIPLDELEKNTWNARYIEYRKVIEQ